MMNSLCQMIHCFF